MPFVTLSLVSWNSADSIEDCLRSALRQTHTDFELWVVDNASSDDTCARVAALAAEDSRIQLHALDRNTGFCGGHNYTLDRTNSEYVMLVNPDIEMEPDYLAKALAAMSTNEYIGTVCGLLLQSRDSDPRIDSAGMNALRDGRFTLRLHGKHLSEALPLERCYVDGADGALPLFRRTFIDDVRVNGQFFDERFFAHKEDWDIAWRGQLFGWCTLFEPACRALHPRQFRPEDVKLRRRLSKNIKADAVKNQWMLMLKNMPKWRFKYIMPFALPRQLAIIAYLLLFERSSLKALAYIKNHWRELRKTRTTIQTRAGSLRFRRNTLPGFANTQHASNPLLSLGVIASSSGGSSITELTCLTTNNPLI